MFQLIYEVFKTIFIDDKFYSWPLIFLIAYSQLWIHWIKYEVKDGVLHVHFPGRPFKRYYAIALADIEEVAPVKPWAKTVQINYSGKQLKLDFYLFKKREKFMKYLSENGFDVH